MVDVLAGRTAVLDGEIVALDAGGAPEFARLQHRMHVRAPNAALLTNTPVLYYLFDVLELDGQRTTGLPYRQRRELVEQLGLNRGVVRTPPAFPEADPGDVYAASVDNRLARSRRRRQGHRR